MCLPRNGRAVGVEYVRNKRTVPDAPQEVAIAIASRLVVISGGTFGSPTILERSGIGAKEVLNRVGVEQIVDLPGVGEHFQGETFYIASNEMSEAQRFDLLDHPTIFVPYLATNDSFTIDGIGRGDKAEIESK